MIQYASAELPALKEAKPPSPRSKGDQLQLTFLQRVLILLATIMMIVIDHGCVSSSPEGHAGFVSEYAFSSSSCMLVSKYFPDQTTVPIGVMTHIARSTCPASTSLPIPRQFLERPGIVYHTLMISQHRSRQQMRSSLFNGSSPRQCEIDNTSSSPTPI